MQTSDLPLCCHYHDSVKIIRGNYNRYFAIITEEIENLKDLEQNDKIEINCLQKSFGKRVFAAHDLVSRLTADLKKVTTSVDSRCWYTITDMWTLTRNQLEISLYNFKQIFSYSWNYQKTYMIPTWFSDNFMVNIS